MKTKFLLLTIIFIAIASALPAQHVRARLSFPLGINIGRPGPAPFSGAIWIGPEWQWRGGKYEYVPGYWDRPHRFRSIWVPGHWKYSRWGYRWVPGHWS